MKTMEQLEEGMQYEMKFEYQSSQMEHLCRSEITYQDNDTMDLDAWTQDGIKLTWGFEPIVRPEFVTLGFFVPDQIIILNDGTELEIKDVQTEHSPADFEYLDKKSINTLVLDKGKFFAHM